MSKSYLDKLHLSRGLGQNSIEIYSKHLNGLNQLKVSDLKKYLYIYEFIYEELLLYIYPTAKNLLLKIDSDYTDLLNANSNISDYLNSRIKEIDLSSYVDFTIYKEWFFSIQNDIYENYSDIERLDIFIKCLNLIVLIDYLLLLKDEYWYPHHNCSILRLKSIDFKFEKIKERIWQPKS